MGTGGCVAFRKQNAGYKKYYVTHDGYKSGLGSCLAKFLESPEFSFEQALDFYDIIWAFRKAYDPKDEGMLNLADYKGTGPDNTYLVDLDAKVVVVARESTPPRKVPCVVGALTEAVREVSGLLLMERSQTLSDDVIGLPWGDAPERWYRRSQSDLSKQQLVYLAQNVLADYCRDTDGQEDWVPHYQEELVVGILRVCAAVEDNPGLRSAAAKALQMFESFRKQRVDLAEDPAFVEESSYDKKTCRVYGVRRLTVQEFKEWCDARDYSDNE